jgi:hypothetical protein
MMHEMTRAMIAEASCQDNICILRELHKDDNLGRQERVLPYSMFIAFMCPVFNSCSLCNNVFLVFTLITSHFVVASFILLK